VIEYIKEDGCDFKTAWPFRFTEDGPYHIKTSRHTAVEYPARKVADTADDFIIVELNMKERNE